MCEELTQDEILENELKIEYYGDCLDKQMGNPIEQLEDLLESTFKR
jgi:hypothetical protein